MCACMCACACTWEHISRKCVIYPNEHWNLPYKQCLPLQIVIWSCGTARSENLKVPLKKHDKDLPNNHYRNEQEINRTYICTTSSSASQTLVEKVKQWGLHISSIQSILHTQIALPLHPIHGAGARKKRKKGQPDNTHASYSKQNSKQYQKHHDLCAVVYNQCEQPFSAPGNLYTQWKPTD